MAVPQISSRLRELPTRALRATFAGIGQLLLVADRLRSQADARQHAEQQGAGTPGPSVIPRPAASPRPATSPRPAGQPEAAKLEPQAGAQAGLQQTGSTQAGAALAGTTQAESTAHAAAAAPGASLPVPDYDDATIASLRARLRNLDVAQLRALTAYERAHAARPDVLGMFERRITRLESGA
jgi:hypothetical protein